MSEKRRIVAKRIGELLIERGVITPEQLQEALNNQQETKKLLGETLIDLGYATEEHIMISLTTQYGIPYLPIESYEIDAEVVNFVPKELRDKYDFLPVDKIGDLLTIVIADVPNLDTISQIEEVLGCKVTTFVTTPTAFKQAVEKYYG